MKRQTNDGFCVAGTDSEDETREAWFDSLGGAYRMALEMMKSDSTGPAWKCAEIWGNLEQGEWACLARM